MVQMIKATIHKQRIADVVERISAGEPIAPEGATWTMIDSLTVAGVLLSSAMSACGHTRPKASGNREGAQRILQDLQATIEFVGAMATAYGNGSWDDYFDPSVSVAIDADGFTPVQGFKRGTPDAS